MPRNHRFYIDGAWIEPRNRPVLTVVDPSTEVSFATVAVANASDIDQAVSAARNAQPDFAATPITQRLTLLKEVAKGLDRRRDEIAACLSREMGAPGWLARGNQVDLGIAHCHETLAALNHFAFERMRASTCIRREPIGVVGLITPWNWPINQIMCKVAPALATGCTMVLKPSELAPLNAEIIAEIIHNAGVPSGVFNLVQGDARTGHALSAHADIDMISITGSTRAGIAVARDAADTVKRVHQELGGKSPYVILQSADLATAVRASLARCFENSGQSCNAPTRLLVPRNRESEAIEVAAQYARDLRTGPPSDRHTKFGPVISAAQYERIQSAILQAMAEGATLACGGEGRPDGLEVGFYVRPTVFANVHNDMTIAREEIFGPVASIIGYDDVDEAVAIANDTPYGLAAYVNGTPAEAECIARRIAAGVVNINEAPWDGAAPFGGYKQSGNGREYGEYGLAEFTEIKAVVGAGYA